MIALLDIHNDSYETAENLGLEVLAANLRKSNIETHILSYSLSKIELDEIIKINPRLIGISLRFSPVEKIIAAGIKIKSTIKNSKLLLGGNVASTVPYEIMKEFSEVDFILLGEGEKSIVGLYNQMISNKEYEKVSDLIYRENNTIKASDNRNNHQIDLNQMPYPVREMQHATNKRIAYIESGRGCTGRCGFCVLCKITPKWHGRSMKNVADEMKDITANSDISLFGFVDPSLENPYNDLRRVEELADEIIKANLDVHYYASMKVKPFVNCTQDSLDKLIKSGFLGCFLGVENFCNNELKFLRKTHTGNEARAVIEKLRNNKLFVDIGIINLTPYTTLSDFEYNIDQLYKHVYLVNYSFVWNLKIFKNSQHYFKLKEDNLLDKQISINEFTYRHTDEKVEILSNYMRQYVNYMEKSFDNFLKINYLSKDLPVLIVRLQRNSTDLEEIEKLNKIIYSFNKCFNQLNEVNYSWTKELINLMNTEWSEKVAVDISNNYLSKSILKNLLNDLLMVEKNLYKFTLKNCPSLMI